MASTLLAVPNVSEGRDERTIAAIAEGFAGAHGGARASGAGTGDGGAGGGEAGRGGASGEAGVRLLDVHSDRDHHRTVYTLAGPGDALVDALLAGARVAVERIDVTGRAAGAAGESGQHPHVGALDVAPLVYLRPQDRGLACACALVLGERIGEELAVPVFLYGELTAGEDGRVRSRAELRRGGAAGLAARMADREQPLAPDFGPPRAHASAGATLVAAREPLVAFNLQLAPPAGIAQATQIAAEIREGGADGLPGLRAIAVELAGGVAQVSMNVERPLELPLARVAEAVRARAPLAGAELVGLAPAAALAGFPADLPMPGFDPARHVIENALRC
ncbi:MAG TPA: hypothetical protein VL979_11315 [Solirubrobacteraceae bacterium]|nr:hypothetical protein [Solirubrobacteraceae bacterium]